MPAEVIQVLALYWVVIGGLSLWFFKRGSDLDKMIRERGKKQ